MIRTFLWTTVTILSLSESAAATGSSFPTTSTFDSGLDGWVRVTEGGVVASDSSILSWVGSGGNPDGYARFDDLKGGEASWIEAPAEFLGDWSSLDGFGEVRFDFRLLNRGGSGTEIGDYGIRFEGVGGVATITIPGPEAESDWETVTATLSEQEWNVNGSWEGLLAEVTALRVKIEIVNNMTTIGEVTGIDNVVVTNPASNTDPTQVGLSIPTIRLPRNPVRDEAVLRWDAPLSETRTIQVFGPSGRHVRSLTASSGSDRVTWNLRDSSGIQVVSGRYFVSDGARRVSLLVLR